MHYGVIDWVFLIEYRSLNGDSSETVIVVTIWDWEKPEGNMVVCELMAFPQLLWQLEPGPQHASISISVLRFRCILKKPVILSFTSNCVTELMMFMRVYAYMYVSYVIQQYRVFIVYINPITNFIVYITTFYSMFHAFDAIMLIVLCQKWREFVHKLSLIYLDFRLYFICCPILLLSWMKHQTNSRSSPSFLNPARFGLGCNTCPAHL